jgi:hypothetical protein
VRDNAALVEKKLDPERIRRAGVPAIKFDINDRWTATALVMSQDMKAYGQWAYTPEAVTVTPTSPDGSSGPSMTLGGTGDLNTVRSSGPEQGPVHDDDARRRG